MGGNATHGSLLVEPEHVLLGLIRAKEEITSRVFTRSNLSIEGIQKEIEKRTTFLENKSTAVQIEFSPTTNRILQHAVTEADNLLHHAIGTDHLLLGILHEESCVAAATLTENGVRLDTARDEVVRVRNHETST